MDALDEGRGSYGRPDPLGASSPAPMRSGADHVEALLAVVRWRIAAAIRRRWASGLLVDRPGPTGLLLDRGRVETLLLEEEADDADAATLAAAGDRALAQVQARLDASRRLGLALPLADAFDTWGLDEGERLLLATAFAAELSPRLSRLLSYLAGDANRAGLVVEAASEILLPDGRGLLAVADLLAPGRALARLALARLGGDPDLPLVRRTVHLAPRLLALSGDRVELDPSLEGAELLAPPAGSLAVRSIDEQTRSRLRALCLRASPGEPVGVVLAQRGAGARDLLADAAAAASRRALLLHVDAAAAEHPEVPIREALLHRAVLVLLDDEALPPGPERRTQIVRRVERLAQSGLPVVLLIERSEPQPPPFSGAVLQVTVPLPDASTRMWLWQEALGGASTGLDLETLASSYRVGAGTIAHAAQGALALAGEAGPLAQDTVTEALRAQVSADLSTVATLLRVTQSWDDLVLPDETADLVAELIGRARQRRRVLGDWGFGRKVGKGHGLVALFSGRPGTGKSMVAGLVARELGLEPYQIDISRVASRWIGETEKSLGLAFDAAESGVAMLIFDEADALFGRRVTDVKSATDRYANLETNFILNRLEWFSGVAVLTTNLEGNFDPAFRRRLSLHAQFPFPDEEQRARLWAAMVPREAPLQGPLDFGDLARRYQLSGGQIRNVALRAAYLAAISGEPLSADWIHEAAERQYQAHGKLTSGGELE